MKIAVITHNITRKISGIMLDLHKLEVEVGLRGKNAECMIYCACS